MPEPGVTRWVVGPNLAGSRLDHGVAALTGMSRRRSKVLVGEGSVWVNGRACRIASKALRLGDVVDILPTPDPLAPPPPPPPPLSVVFEDGWLIAVDKPPGVPSQAGRQRLAGELSAAEHLCLQLSLREGHRVELKLVHRLDRIASGILLFAKHHDAAAQLSRLFAGRSVEKTYLAFVSGNPPAHTTLHAPIAPDPLVPERFRVAPGGKAATTVVRVLARSGPIAALELRPLTGRTHQLRVHLQSIGCPIVGDSLYGSPIPAPRPMLHALALQFPHPKDGHPVHLKVAPPLDFLAFGQTHGVDISEV